MTREQFLHSEISNISQVYFGKNQCCRCGCEGTYIATSYMINPRSEVNDILAQSRLERAKKLVLEGAKVDYEDTYVNVVTGRNKALTFYFDEIKK